MIFAGINFGKKSTRCEEDLEKRRRVLDWLRYQKDITRKLRKVINTKDSRVGDTPLKLASKQGWDEKYLLWLFELGADISVLPPCTVRGIFDRLLESLLLISEILINVLGACSMKVSLGTEASKSR